MLKLFKTSNIKPRQFEYKPRSYDPDKEALERRMKARANNDSAELTKMRLRREFSSYRDSSIKQSSSSNFINSSSFRLLLIVCFLLIASYFVLDNLLPQFLEYLFPEDQGYDLLEEYDVD